MGLKMPSPRIIGALLCGVLAIGVDFTSQILSISADMICVSGIFILLWPVIVGSNPNNNG